MKKTLTAAVAAAMLVASPFAATGALAMGQELTMLEAAVDNQFNALGITDYQMGELTLSQLSLIRAVLGSSDYSQTEKKQQIEQVLAQ